MKLFKPDCRLLPNSKYIMRNRKYYRRIVIGLIAISLFTMSMYLLAGYFKPDILKYVGAAVIQSEDKIIALESLEYYQFIYKRKYLPFKFRLHIFIIDLRQYETGIAKTRETINYFHLQQHNTLTLNANYFDHKNEPTLMLKNENEIYSPVREIFSGLFWRKNNYCDIQHISDFIYSDNMSVIIQSTPRLISNGNITKGVMGLQTVDSRSGIGITRDRRVIIYASDNNIFSGFSQQEIRNIFLEQFNTMHLMSLDGGSSVQFCFTRGSLHYQVKGGRKVPYLIYFREK